jgi:formamidopyrimidine-DNA glycosylase
MPELPEVETIRRGLQTHLVGHKIERIAVRLAKQVTGDTQKILHAKIIAVRRFGKGLVIDLDNEYSMAIHIKMTGQLIYQKVPRVSQVSHVVQLSNKVGELPGKATHVIFYLDRDAVLYYNDVRQFGWIKIVKTNEVGELPFFKNLGPEMLKDMSYEKFAKLLGNTKGPIKSLLMEQSKIAGVGNIYANDALFRAKIHPKRSAQSLSEDEQKELFIALEAVLQKGIEAGGSSEWSYVNALGEEGSYQKIFLIYNQDGKPCPRCGTCIQKCKLGGRGTFYCPTCQVLPL